MNKNKMIQAIIACFIVFAVLAQSVLPVNAMTVYETDGIYHDEGWIVIGESHSVSAAIAFGVKAAESDNTLHIGDNIDISYIFKCDNSQSEVDNCPNTFTMKGNLFFVFEGIAPSDGANQSSNQYIYSNGKGSQGRGVQKIHEIINNNPNIAHWNIISIHGAAAAKRGSKEAADYFVRSYRNWMEYEFPEADCYFLSVSTMTKAYKPTKDRKIFNNTLAEAFPDRFFDYTDFYKARYPQHTVDTIHWDAETYIDLLTDTIQKINQRRQAAIEEEQEKESSLAYEVTEVQAVFYTNDKTVMYTEPALESKVMIPSCEIGIPIQVTGVTDNGFFRVSIDNVTYYIPGDGLIDQE